MTRTRPRHSCRRKDFTSDIHALSLYFPTPPFPVPSPYPRCRGQTFIFAVRRTRVGAGRRQGLRERRGDGDRRGEGSAHRLPWIAVVHGAPRAASSLGCCILRLLYSPHSPFARCFLDLLCVGVLLTCRARGVRAPPWTMLCLCWVVVQCAMGMRPEVPIVMRGVCGMPERTSCFLPVDAHAAAHVVGEKLQISCERLIYRQPAKSIRSPKYPRPVPSLHPPFSWKGEP